MVLRLLYLISVGASGWLGLLADQRRDPCPGAMSGAGESVLSKTTSPGGTSPGAPEGLTLTNGSSGAVYMACVGRIPSPSNDPGTRGYPVSFPVPNPPLISVDAAAKALLEYFLANADRGDNAANDELTAELLRRIRALRAAHENGC
jgi:hypothetical protein